MIRIGELTEDGFQPHSGTTPEQKETAIKQIIASLADSANWHSPDKRLAILREDIARLILGEVVTPEELFTPEFHAAAESELRDILRFDTALSVHGSPRALFKELCEQWRVPNDQVRKIVIEEAGELLHDEKVSKRVRTYVHEFLSSYGIDESEVPIPPGV